MHISSDSIRYVGKETNELDRAEVTGAFPEDETQYTDYCKILMRIKSARDWKNLGLSRKRIIDLQKECRNGNINMTKNVKEKLRKFYDRKI